MTKIDHRDHKNSEDKKIFWIKKELAIIMNLNQHMSYK